MKRNETKRNELTKRVATDAITHTIAEIPISFDQFNSTMRMLLLIGIMRTKRVSSKNNEAENIIHSADISLTLRRRITHNKWKLFAKTNRWHVAHVFLFPSHSRSRAEWQKWPHVISSSEIYLRSQYAWIVRRDSRSFYLGIKLSAGFDRQASGPTFGFGEKIRSNDSLVLKSILMLGCGAEVYAVLGQSVGLSFLDQSVRCS